jgi:hypothetical protein
VVHFPVDGPGGQNSHKCFWGVSYTQETRNIIWPDSHTDYPVSIDTIPAGGKIVLRGQYPHARFFSLTTSSTFGTIRGHLYDVDIKPDPGSTNPFLPGANRNARHRSFTVIVVDQPDPGPGHEQPNVLYGGVAGQAPGAGPMLLVERVYLPDRGRDFSGGVGEPTASYVAANGTTSTGQAPCGALKTKPGAFNLTDVNPLLFPESKIAQLLALSSSPLLVYLQQRRTDQRQDKRAVPRRRGGPDQRSARLHGRAEPPPGPPQERDRQVRRGVDELGHNRRRLHPAAVDDGARPQSDHHRPSGVPERCAEHRCSRDRQAGHGHLPTYVNYTDRAQFQRTGCTKTK